MILDNIIQAAFKLINTVAPSLNPQRFLDGMKGDFDPDLSDEENYQNMMRGIKEDKYGFGSDLADAASYETKTDKSFEEMLEENPDVKSKLGVQSKKKGSGQKGGATQHKSN